MLPDVLGSRQSVHEQFVRPGHCGTTWGHWCRTANCSSTVHCLHRSNNASLPVSTGTLESLMAFPRCSVPQNLRMKNKTSININSSSLLSSTAFCVPRCSSTGLLFMHKSRADTKRSSIKKYAIPGRQHHDDVGQLLGLPHERSCLMHLLT